MSEVLVQAKRPASPREIGLPSCRATLSFVLLRAAAIGVNKREHEYLAFIWDRTRQRMGQAETLTPPSIVTPVVRTFLDVVLGGEYRQSNRERVSDWFEIVWREGPEALVDEIERRFDLPSDVVGLGRNGDKTAEERVRIFDQIAPRLLNQFNAARSELAFVLAYIAVWCRPGFAEQQSLLLAHSGKLPEAGLWLGAMQSNVPLIESLSMGGGLGWRIARDLFQFDDLFSPPTSDFSVSELSVLMRGKNVIRTIKPLDKSRYDVEILPGVTTLVRNIEHPVVEPAKPKTEQPMLNLELLPSVENILGAVEESLEKSLRIIRESRTGKISQSATKASSPGKSRKKKSKL